jgi:dihydroneopterin aldolase
VVPGRIRLDGIRADGHHGVDDEERERAQPFEVDVRLQADLQAAAASDRLEDTVDYAALENVVIETVGGKGFHLLETLAAAIGQKVLDRWPLVAEVEVAIRKPEAPMPGPLDRVEVRIRLVRRREAGSPG